MGPWALGVENAVDTVYTAVRRYEGARTGCTIQMYGQVLAVLGSGSVLPIIYRVSGNYIPYLKLP